MLIFRPPMVSRTSRRRAACFFSQILTPPPKLAPFALPCLLASAYGGII